VAKGIGAVRKERKVWCETKREKRKKRLANYSPSKKKQQPAAKAIASNHVGKKELEGKS